MKENIKFYRCAICGNIIWLVEGNIKSISCCGKNMELMEANVVDASVEKHVPVYQKVEDEIVVRVGEIEHPMTEAHYIEWIAVETSNGAQMKMLKPGQAPKAEFMLVEGETVEAVYAYCNLHGLWKM